MKNVKKSIVNLFVMWYFINCRQMAFIYVHTKRILRLSGEFRFMDAEGVMRRNGANLSGKRTEYEKGICFLNT